MAVLLLAMVGGCSSEPVPTESEAPASSASAVLTETQEPTPTPSSELEPTAALSPAPKPVMPAEMANGDEAGAIAAVKYFLELIPYGFGSGDIAELAAMSSPECAFCADFVGRITDLHDQGGTAAGGEWTWDLATEYVNDTRNGVFWISMTGWTEPAVASPNGADATTSAAPDADRAHYAIEVVVSFDSGQWVVHEVRMEDLP
jgi:hypothetical protein